MARCSAITASGARCSRRAAEGEQWCFGHDPKHAEARREVARRGGKARHNKAGRDLEAVKKRLWALADQIVAGQIDPRRATAAGQLLNTWLRASEAEHRLVDMLELSEKLDVLEAALQDRVRGHDAWGA